jgi:hypothetical protein
MITREEFQRAVHLLKRHGQALKVIEEYHKQFDALSRIEEPHMTLSEFVQKVSISTRLKNVLTQLPPDTYLDEIYQYTLCRLRNCGHVSWGEFCTKRREYIERINPR